MALHLRFRGGVLGDEQDGVSELRDEGDGPFWGDGAVDKLMCCWSLLRP